MNHVSSQLINFSLSPANRFISLSLVLILLVLSSIYVRWYINYTDHSQIPVHLSAIKSWIAPNFLSTNEAKSGVILKCHTHPDSSHKKGAKVLMTFLYLWYLSFCILFYISGAFCNCGLKSVLHIYALFLFLKMILKPDTEEQEARMSIWTKTKIGKQQAVTELGGFYALY